MRATSWDRAASKASSCACAYTKWCAQQYQWKERERRRRRGGGSWRERGGEREREGEGERGELLAPPQTVRDSGVNVRAHVLYVLVWWERYMVSGAPDTGG